VAVILSPTTKESIKTALAMTIAFGVGLGMGWDRPYWAGFAVAFISLSTTGQSLNKASLRMAGTVLGAVVALIVIGLAAQQRWLFILCVCLWCGFCTYMMGGKRHQYFWHVSGFVFAIVAVDGGPFPDNAFATAMLRLQQTALGIMVYSLVAVLLWPTNPREKMAAAAVDLVKTQADIFDAYLQLFRGQTDGQRVKSRYAEEMAQLAQFGVLLDAASTDAEDVREVNGLWRDYQSAAGQLAETLQRWHENFGDLRGLALEPLLPGLDVFSAELGARLKAVEQLLKNEPSVFTCSQTRMDINPEALQRVSHFHRAALVASHGQLLQMERLTRQLHASMRGIRGDQGALDPVITAAGKPDFLFIPDPDRLLASAKVMVALGLAFLAVVYISGFPTGFAFITMCAPYGMALFTTPQMRISVTYMPLAFGIAFGGALYILVMPHLHSFFGLGLMLFAATFFLCQRFSTPQQALGRVMGLAMFVSLISVSNQQSYSFLGVANTALMLSLMLLLLNIVSYLPYPPRPERAILHLLQRYFDSADFLLSQPAAGTGSRYASWREAYHLQEITTLPGKIGAWGAQANSAFLGELSAQQIPALTASLQALSFRQQELFEVRKLAQSPRLATALSDDMQAWRQQMLTALQVLSADPSQGGRLQRARLNERLARVEKRVEEMLNQVGSEALETEYEGNLYRLLGAYRGSSEALLDFAQLCDEVDWGPWYEERFA
jgi:uncharacterized membrane protein YccC